MAHGTKPYARTAQVNTVYGVADMGELAARVGSIDTFDRRGNVVWMDNFEDGINKWNYGGGAGWAVALSPLYSRNGGFSCQMIPGAGVGLVVDASHYAPVPVSGAFGAEISWTYIADLREVWLRFSWYDGTVHHRTELVYDAPAGNIDVLVPPGVLQPIITGVALPNTNTLFHTWKLVVDFGTDTYVRVLFDNQTVNLTGVPIVTAASAAGPWLWLNFRKVSAVAGPQASYHDDAIITQNEP